MARNNIAVRNLCFLKDVAVSGTKPSMTVGWTLQGAWAKDPQARLAVILQQVDPATKKVKEVAVLRKDVLASAGKTDVDVAAYSGKSFRIAVRKVGDAETGGLSNVFDLN